LQPFDVAHSCPGKLPLVVVIVEPITPDSMVEKGREFFCALSNIDGLFVQSRTEASCLIVHAKPDFFFYCCVSIATIRTSIREAVLSWQFRFIDAGSRYIKSLNNQP